MEGAGTLYHGGLPIYLHRIIVVPSKFRLVKINHSPMVSQATNCTQYLKMANTFTLAKKVYKSKTMRNTNNACEDPNK